MGFECFALSLLEDLLGEELLLCLFLGFPLPLLFGDLPCLLLNLLEFLFLGQFLFLPGFRLALLGLLLACFCGLLGFRFALRLDRGLPGHIVPGLLVGIHR